MIIIKPMCFVFIRMNVAAPGIKDTEIGRGITAVFGGVPKH